MNVEKFCCVSSNDQYNDIQNDNKSVKRINIIRIEHPNCAIYKKRVSTIEEDLVRQTLMTPSKRLTKDICEIDGTIKRHFVSKETHLDTLLVYLKDIVVSINSTEILSCVTDSNDAILVGEMSATPYTQILTNWISIDNYKELSKTKAFASCIYQLKKIIKAQMQCAQEVAQKYGIKYFTFADTIEPMEYEKFEKHFYKYYRQASKEYEGLSLVVKISNNINEYNEILDRKHIKGAIAVIN